MAGDSHRWERNPLLSAAEVVQDSADRMESVYRILLHEQKLLQSDPTDPKLLTSIDYHRRDVATALGATKWQLEDFERALSFFALSNISGLGEITVSRHQQFIRAIGEQISRVEKTLEELPTGNLNENGYSIDVTEQERDGFASFLYGDKSTDDDPYFDSESKIMQRYYDSTSASVFDEKSGEIVELQSEEIDHLKSSCSKQMENSLDTLKGNELRKSVPYSKSLAYESSASLQVLTGEEECNNSHASCDALDVKVATSRDMLNGLHNKVNAFRFPNIWPVLRSKMSNTFIKRRKDGELPENYAVDVERGQLEQNKRAWLGLTSSLDWWTKTVKSYSWLRSFKKLLQRCLYVIQNNHLPMRLLLAISLSLTMIGILTYCAA